MAKILKSIGMSAAFAVAGLLSGEAGAMPPGGSGKAALAHIDLVAQAQYSYEGKDYCWYDDGWNGPGWYVCGQYTVRGVGWGGGAGWHGWVHTGGGTVGRGGGGRVGGGRTGGQVGGRTGGSRTGSARTGGSRTGSARTGGSRTGGSRTGGGRTGGGRTGGGRSGGGGRGGGRHSDILLKHDIALLGRLDNGLGFYRFSYNGSDKTYVGVMAQEVEAVMPGAVTRGSDGYLRVHYDALGVKFQTYDRWLASGAVVPSDPPMRH
jgi:hypothetical protein